jgi:hypothetical protein
MEGDVNLASKLQGKKQRKKGVALKLFIRGHKHGQLVKANEIGPKKKIKANKELILFSESKGVGFLTRPDPSLPILSSKHNVVQKEGSAW